MKKTPGDITILHRHIINDKSYDAWFLKYEAQQTELFVILGHFWPLTPLTPGKSKF